MRTISSNLDHIYASFYKKKKSTTVVNSLMSDHKPIKASISLCERLQTMKHKKKLPNLFKINFEELSKDLPLAPWEQLLDYGDNIEEMALFTTKTISILVKLHTPIITIQNGKMLLKENLPMSIKSMI